MRICICGGGALSHVCSAVIGSLPDVEVCVLTRKPNLWSNCVKATDNNGKVYKATIVHISNEPADVITDCDLIVLCLPGFAIEDELRIIKPYIGNAIVCSIVSSTGFFFFAHSILGENAKLFGFQRTPFIARTDVYGQSAHLLGYKKQVAIAAENIENKDELLRLVEKLWKTPCSLLANHYEASLTNSNPILHTGRLYSLWKDWKGEAIDHNILFYKEWTNDASQIIINMDSEFQNLLRKLNVRTNAIPTLLKYYESNNTETLTKKIQSIEAFQNIIAPMQQTEYGWIPDFNSRYFTEDFPFGLYYIWRLAHENDVDVPTIDKVYKWGVELNRKQI